MTRSKNVLSRMKFLSALPKIIQKKGAELTLLLGRAQKLGLNHIKYLGIDNSQHCLSVDYVRVETMCYTHRL